MSTLNTSMNAIKVTFDDGDVITGRVVVQDDVVFRGAVAPQLASIEFDDFIFRCIFCILRLECDYLCLR